MKLEVKDIPVCSYGLKGTCQVFQKDKERERHETFCSSIPEATIGISRYTRVAAMAEIGERKDLKYR